MVVDEDIGHDERLGNGDTLSERIDAVNVHDDEICSPDEMRERLGR